MDEYEVARLHLDSVEKARREAEFGSDVSVSVLLHPPILRAMGMNRKIRLRGGVAELSFRMLRAAKRIRGTRLDVFGYARVRKVERQLVGEYQTLVRTALENLSDATLEQILEVCTLPDMVRGYEDIKLANVERFRARATDLLADLDGTQ